MTRRIRHAKVLGIEGFAARCDWDAPLVDDTGAVIDLDAIIGTPGPQGPPGSLFNNKWTNATRPSTPGTDLVGYNTEEEQPELYILVEDKWYYLWQGPIGVVPPTSPTIFSDDFESGWVDVDGFAPLWSENFQTGWFTDNTFSSLFQENFQNGGW